MIRTTEYKFKDAGTIFVNALRVFFHSRSLGCRMKCITPFTKEQKSWNVGKTVKRVIEEMNLDIDPYNPPAELTASINVVNENIGNKEVMIKDIIFSDGKKHFSAPSDTVIGLLKSPGNAIHLEYILEVKQSREQKTLSNVNVTTRYDGDDDKTIILIINITNSGIDDKKYIRDVFSSIKLYIDNYIMHLGDSYSSLIESETKGNVTIFRVFKERSLLVSIMESQAYKLFPRNSNISITARIEHLAMNQVLITCLNKDNISVDEGPTLINKKHTEIIIKCLNSFVEQLQTFKLF